MKLADRIWEDVNTWPWLAQKAMGNQLIRSIDSVAANISEGHGRFHYRDRIQFLYYSRGSLQEALTWIQKAQNRNLIPSETCVEYTQEIRVIRQMLNGFIRHIRSANANQARRPSPHNS